MLYFLYDISCFISSAKSSLGCLIKQIIITLRFGKNIIMYFDIVNYWFNYKISLLIMKVITL